jgi:hypothetical protein
MLVILALPPRGDDSDEGGRGLGVSRKRHKTTGGKPSSQGFGGPRGTLLNLGVPEFVVKLTFGHFPESHPPGLHKQFIRHS